MGANHRGWFRGHGGCHGRGHVGDKWCKKIAEKHTNNACEGEIGGTFIRDRNPKRHGIITHPLPLYAPPPL